MLDFPATSLWDDLSVSSLPLVLYGTGDGADKIWDQLALRGLAPAAVFSSDDFSRPGRTFRGLPVETLSQVEARLPEFMILVAFGSHLPELHERVEMLARRHPLRIPDVPVAGGGLFDLNYALAHKAELSEAYSLLADEASRKVFQSVLSYKITGRPEFLFADETPSEEAWALLSLGDSEDYLDLGAYRGDTVQAFLEQVGSADGGRTPSGYADNSAPGVAAYSTITALEPDPVSFRKLTEHFGSLPRTTLLQRAVSSASGTAYFAKGRGRGSHVALCGADRGPAEASLANGLAIAKTMEIPLSSVDDLVRELGHSFSYIKVDTEGAEREVLLGASKLLSDSGPKLNLALYHRNEDLFELPLLLHQLNPDYRLYLRRHPCFPCWDLNLYAAM